MIKIKLGELLNSREPMAKLLGKELPVKTAYKLSKLVKEVNNEFKNFEEQRQNLVKKHGKEDENSKSFTVPKEKVEEFQNEINDLLKVEVEINQNPISVNDLASIQASPVDLAAMEKFIVE